MFVVAAFAAVISVKANAESYKDTIQYHPAFFISGQITSKSGRELKPICPFEITIGENEKKSATCHPILSSMYYQADFTLTKSDEEGEYILTRRTTVTDSGAQLGGYFVENPRDIKTMEDRTETFKIADQTK